MLKLSSPYIIQALAKLFNLILSSGDFPETWSEGLITPIYKKGDKFDPSNYRGICVGSNLAKLFCNIINNRIVTFLTRRNILNKSQIGFLPKQRTSDHIYSLHTLINKNLKGKKRKIFTCFVDFKKKLLTLFGMMVYYTNYYKLALVEKHMMLYNPCIKTVNVRSKLGISEVRSSSRVVE